MSPIEYDPPSLKVVAESPYANKRLKNRNGRFVCSKCSTCYEDHLPAVLTEAQKHNLIHPEATIKISGDGCGFGLL